jgi:hypothetical protein
MFADEKRVLLAQLPDEKAGTLSSSLSASQHCRYLQRQRCAFDGIGCCAR